MNIFSFWHRHRGRQSSSSGDGKLVWYKNDGNGSFQDEQIISNSLQDPGNIVTWDSDGDNTLDIAIVVYDYNGDNDRVVWFANDGLPWEEQNIIPATAGLGPGDLDIADVDGDSDLDIVVASLDAGTVELYYNNMNPLTDKQSSKFYRIKHWWYIHRKWLFIRYFIRRC